MYVLKHDAFSASRLYNLQPIGIGTPHEESLASYIKRLAEAHCVAPAVLLQNEVLPHIKSKIHVQNLISTYPSVKINSFSTRLVDYIVEVLEEKTNNYDSASLSIRKWRDFLNPYNSIRKCQAWCPICYENSLELEEPLYEQYIWSFKDVEICKIHQIRLVDKCLHCNNDLAILNYSSRIGYCDNCKTWLGSKNYSGECITQIEKEWFNWVYDNIGRLISSPPPASKLLFMNNINALIEKYSVKAISKELKIYPEVIIRWASGKNADITNLLNLSYKLCISLYDLFTQDISKYNPQFHIARTILRKSRSKLDKNKMDDLVDRAIESDPTITIKKLAALLHISLESVKRLFPEEVTRVKTNYSNYLQESKKANQNQIKNVIETLNQKGLYPSLSAIRKELSKSIWLNSGFKEVWVEAINELDIRLNQDRILREFK